MTQNVKPVFLLAGGRHSRSKKPDALVQAVFQTYGIKSPTVAYSGTASGDDKDFFRFIAESFVQAGADKVVHALIAPEGADIKKAKSIMESADIVFISGGDVEAGMDVLQEKNMLDFLTGLYKQGKPFFGISAGAIMLADRWVRWTDPNDDNSAELFPCLGFAPIICDTHDEQAGWDELQAALTLVKDGVKGYGLASGSGIMVTADGTVATVGGTVYQYVRRGNKVVRLDDVQPLERG
jgi:peptidase E